MFGVGSARWPDGPPQSRVGFSLIPVRVDGVEGTLNKDMTNDGMTFSDTENRQPLSQTRNHTWRTQRRVCACGEVLSVHKMTPEKRNVHFRWSTVGPPTLRVQLFLGLGPHPSGPHPSGPPKWPHSDKKTHDQICWPKSTKVQRIFFCLSRTKADWPNSNWPKSSAPDDTWCWTGGETPSLADLLGQMQ